MSLRLANPGAAAAIAGAGTAGAKFNGFMLHKIGGLSVSAAGKGFIKRQEGFRSGLYDLDGDQGRNCTVGYGHLVHSGPCTGAHPAEHPFLNGIDQTQADIFFDKDVKIAESDVRGLFAPDVRVTQPMFDAYVSLLFNLGRNKADPRWNVFENTRNGNYAAAAPEFLNIDKVTDPVTGKKSAVAGLTARRKRESQLFLKGIY